MDSILDANYKVTLYFSGKDDEYATVAFRDRPTVGEVIYWQNRVWRIVSYI
jgi:hypothetical protein